MQLINLHTNSEYSFLSSTIKIDSLINYAIQNNLSTLVLTDINNLFAVPKFYHLCKKNNINPIIGLQLEAENYHFILLAKNYLGYQHLSALSSKKMHNQEISILELSNENVIIIDHPELGFYTKNKQQLKLDNYYVVSNDVNLENAVFVQNRCVLYAKEEKYLKYLYKIKGADWVDKKFYDFQEWSIDVDESIIKRTNELVSNIQIEFPKPFFNLPDVPSFTSSNANDNLKSILEDSVIKKQDELKNYPQVRKRLSSEYKVISELNFSNYFLLIWDFIKWARSQNILIGPGRGSSSGSLISYLLDITQINPLRYDLLFERFLNPLRQTMPDIDIDIQDTRRSEVIDYIQKTYGYEHTATIITFSTLAARSVFRDVSKAFGISESEVNANSKLIKPNMTLQECYDEEKSAFRSLIDRQEQDKTYKYKEIFEISKFLEGMPRQSGTHAAGIVVSKVPIYQLVPTLESKDGYNQVQFSAEYLEEFSLLKIDLLGLKNLNIVQQILTLIAKENHELSFEDLPLFDVATNNLLSSGLTSGIFQLESPGMSSTLRGVGVDSIEDVIATISLFRPGPLKQIPIYKQRKNNKIRWESISYEYDQIVAPTYGIIIYQEQIMQICQQIAGFNLAQADIIRVAISKKDESKLIAIKDSFIEAAIKKGHKLEYIEKIYELIYKFADYGFNKAHAAAYATLAYKMAYLKTKFPAQFYSCLISNENGSHENIKKYALEAQKSGFKICQPDINHSFENATFDLEEKLIFLPLTMIKGIGSNYIRPLLKEREAKGKYSNFIDFFLRMKIINFSETLIIKLIKASALASFGSQDSLLASVEIAKNYYPCILEDAKGEKYIDYSQVFNIPFVLKEVEIDYQQTIKNEIEFLGMQFSKPPIPKALKNQIKLVDLEANQQYSLNLVVNNFVLLKSKAGSSYAKISLSDFDTQVDVLLFGSKISLLEQLKKGSIFKFLINKNLKNEFKIYNNKFEEIEYE
ncbi:DNA polymerase III subunit alpha [Mesomycoplasma conjunctivae]|uniref:DNA polymerase III subunit alpha n=1 Tax=Mesomycoplasma conjunctivae TaxID=45361 RepID=UPI003DA65C40